MAAKKKSKAPSKRAQSATPAPRSAARAGKGTKPSSKRAQASKPAPAKKAAKQPAKRAAAKTARPRAARADHGAKALGQNPFLSTVGLVKSDVDARLATLLGRELAAAAARGKPVELMAEAARDLSLRGGKRLRAALVAAGEQLVTQRAPSNKALELGVAVELLQSYFLIHDDWMDQDSVRRGGPTAHVQLSALLGSEKLGERAAILAGDWIVALAQRVLAQAKIPAARASDALTAFAEMQLDAVLGQQLDLCAFEDAEQTYELKTGSYSVRGPLRLGAVLAGATPKLLALIDAFSLPIGVAFQLRDDLIGAFGTPAETGKPAGNDLRQGKHTVLVQLARPKLDAAGLAALERVFGKEGASDEDVAAALAAVEASGARAAVEEKIDQLVQRALTALAAAKLPAAARALLDGAARALTARAM